MEAGRLLLTDEVRSTTEDEQGIATEEELRALPVAGGNRLVEVA